MMNPNTPANTQELLLPYIDMGIGFLIGLSVGYVLKKSFKLMLIFLGLGIISLFILESNGLITINESQVMKGVSTLSSYFQEFVAFLKNRLELFTASKGLSAIAGFFIGLKIG